MIERGIEEMTQEEQLIEFMETRTTREMLIEVLGGKEPREADIKLVSEIQENTGLPTGVMNVLINYVLLTSDFKLSRPYMEKIANNWAMKGIKTVLEAMDYCRKWEQQASKYKATSQKKEKFVMPEWMNEKKEATPVERERIKAIQSAIDTGLANEKLGEFVRNLFKGE